MEKYIYADNAATTCISDEVLKVMMPYLKSEYGNASSIYALGRRSGFAIEDARAKVAKALGAEPREIFFTSGGSEADNWAIKGAAALGAKKGKKHIITTVFEHHAVLHTTESLEKQGFEITYLPVSPEGYVTADDVEKAIRPDTCVVSIMYANNEIGTIQPIKEIGAVCKKHDVLFHTDAVQAVGNVEINVKDQNIDMLSMSGHKIHAQKGIGAFYCRKGLRLDNLIHGGGQESGRRAGTENVAAIVGLGKAIEIATANIPAKIEKVSKMRDRLIEELLKVPVSRLNGGRSPRLCGNVNISFVGVEGESLLLMLDHFGIAASSGSACTTGDLDPSHVLLSLGLVHEVAHGSLRLSISEDFTDDDIDYIIKTVPEVVLKLRNISPLWEHMQNGEVEIKM